MNNSVFNDWYAVAFSKDIKTGQIYPISLLGEPLILFRDSDNNICCLQDRCSHRSTPLSLGRIDNGRVECKYHGWQFAGDGKCTHIPALGEGRASPPRSCVPAKLTIVKHGLVWVHSGVAKELALDDKYDQLFSESENSYRADYSIDLDIPHELMVENLLDPSHLPFTHHGTLSKREKASPIDFTVEHASDRISSIATVVNDSNTIDFVFIKPYVVCFDVAFSANKGMRQVHFCIPVAKNKMRLNSVFFYKNMSWFKFIPFMGALQRRMSRKIVQQDIAMLVGQHKNLLLGAKAWNQAISADKMAQSYRNWLQEELEKSAPWFAGF
jgi:phenylpropionate dioxygenase-like ring-hydroxylating dioxygenase large terminal subunit